MNEKWKRILEELESEKIVSYQSDTVPSIYGRLSSYESLKSIKQRGDNKPFILLCSSIEMIMEYVSIKYSFSYLRKVLASHIGETIIFESKNKHPHIAKDNTVAIRIPLVSDLRTVIEMIGEPIFSTSLETNDSLLTDERITFIDGYDIYKKQRPSRIFCLIESKYKR